MDGSGNPIYRYQETGAIFTGNPEIDLTTTPEEAVGVMGALGMLSTSIQMVLDGDTVNGYDKMNKSLDEFSKGNNEILNQQTKFGSVFNRMEMSNSTLETTNDKLTSYVSELNSIDYAEAVTQWMNAQYAYEASMKIAASSMNMNLLNYLQ